MGAAEFKFQGRKLYLAESDVKSGQQIFRVGSKNFRSTIPAADDGQVYMFILDAKRPSSPRLSMFKKSLLDH